MHANHRCPTSTITVTDIVIIVTIEMSDLQRSFLKAKLAHLPREPPMPANPPPPDLFTYDEREEEEDDEAGNSFGNQEDLHSSPSLDSSSESSTSSTSTLRPLFARPKQ